jgi:hypothetical protein
MSTKVTWYCHSDEHNSTTRCTFSKLREFHDSILYLPITVVRVPTATCRRNILFPSSGQNESIRDSPISDVPKFRSFDKAKPNSQFRGKYIRDNLIRIWVSLICKLSGTPD